MNDKSSYTHFLIKVLFITLTFQSRTMTTFFDTLTAYECLWGCYFTFLHTKLLIMSHPNSDDTWIRVLYFSISIWQMTLTLAYILNQYRNTLSYHLKDHAKCFVSVFHIGMDMTFIHIHRQFLPNEPCLNLSNCNKLKTVSGNLISVNVISIVHEISGITVKIVCKMTFDENGRIWRILQSYFLRKAQKSSFSTCFFIPRNAWMNTKFTTL